MIVVLSQGNSSQLQTLSGWDEPTEIASAWQMALTAMAEFTVSFVTSTQGIPALP